MPNQFHIACSQTWGNQAENNHEITAEVQANYPNFKQKLAEKENFNISKVKKPAGIYQMLVESSQVPKNDNCVLSEEQRIRKQKSSQKAVFSRYLFTDNWTKRFLAQP